MPFQPLYMYYIGIWWIPQLLSLCMLASRSRVRRAYPWASSIELSTVVPVLYIPVMTVRTGVLNGMLVVVSSVVDNCPRTPAPLRACRELSVARRELATSFPSTMSMAAVYSVFGNTRNVTNSTTAIIMHKKKTLKTEYDDIVDDAVYAWLLGDSRSTVL